MNDLTFVIAIFIITLIIGIGTFVGTQSVDNSIVQKDCSQVQEETNFETKFEGGFFTKRCYIKLNDNWVPGETWRTQE